MPPGAPSARGGYRAGSMRILWAHREGGGERADGGAGDAGVDPVTLVAADRRPAPSGRPWVLANMISSADGSATDGEGRSGGLGGPADRAMFSAIRGVADVVVAGASTVAAEDYGPGTMPARVRALRTARGQAPVPRIAVTSASLAVEPTRRLFAEASADTRPLVLTVATADPARRRALAEVADVHVVGDVRVDWSRAFSLLHDTFGARVVVCEGGPQTLGQLVVDDLLDELCLTVAPTLVAGDGPRITVGPAPVARACTLSRVVAADDVLFLRYVRTR